MSGDTAAALLANIKVLFIISRINVLAGARRELAYEAGMRAWI
jgi:hypothetical protein